MRKVITLENDDKGNLVLPLDDEILKEVGWETGDTIEWVDNKDGSWTMKKKVETELVLVECVSMFRERYVVEVPKGHSEWALDTVVMQEAKEFSQEHIGENIISHRVMSKEEVLALCDVDNDYAKRWSNEYKFETFVTKVKE
jgi:bifunctional DNA-binding transcriptional regulator/antitoxin component of YhaV-PrlF toxin-antitoxin module